MDMCSFNEIEADSPRVELDLVSKLVERFKGGFATDWSEVFLFEDGVLVTDRALHGG